LHTVELLQKCVDYIEENLQSEITIAELAEIAGFSQYHFCHLFCIIVGMPVAAYITKRRLMAAAYAMQNGAKVTDVALAYGFDTHAGFYKAFKREFGCSPTKFLKLNTVQRPQSVNLFAEGRFMLTQTQIRQMLNNWDIEEKPEIGNVYIGTRISKEAWVIGSKYILKTGKNVAGLKTHIAISKALLQNGMDAAYPIPTKSGADYILKEDRYYVLVNKIKGECLRSSERYDGNRFCTGVKYGEAIARLHQILRQYDQSLEVNDHNMVDTTLSWAMPKTKQIMAQWGMPLPDEFYQEYSEIFPTLYQQLPRHIIHRDPNPSNIMFADGEVSGFTDFVISERNIRLFDPCYCATGILSEAGSIVPDGYEKWPEIFRGIIHGYDRHAKLSPKEKQAIPYIVYSIQMICIAWMDQQEELKEVAKQNREMLKWLWDNRQVLQVE